MIVFSKDNQIGLAGFEPNCENNYYNRNLKCLRNKKHLKLDVNERISSVKLLPFYSNKSSTILTFILIGLENGRLFRNRPSTTTLTLINFYIFFHLNSYTGTIKIFNESLICLFEFKFANTPVFDFKLFSSSNELNPDQITQSVFVQYEEFCIKIDGLQLVFLLRQNETKLQQDQPLSNNVFYEIWYLKKNFNDFVYCGLMHEPIYDYLIQQTSFNQDSYFKLKDQRSIKRDLLVTVGNDQFLNFYDLNKNETEISIKGTISYNRFVFQI